MPFDWEDDDPYAADSSFADSVFGDPYAVTEGGLSVTGGKRDQIAQFNTRQMQDEWKNSGRFKWEDISEVLKAAMSGGSVAAGAQLGKQVAGSADLLPEALLATLRGAAKTPPRLATNAARATAALLPAGSPPNTVESSLAQGDEMFAPGPGEDPGALATEIALTAAVPGAGPQMPVLRRAATNAAINAGVGAVTGGETEQGAKMGAATGALLGGAGSLTGSGMRAWANSQLADEAARFAKLFEDYAGTSVKRNQRVTQRVVPHLMRAQDPSFLPPAPSIGREAEAAPLLRAGSLNDITAYARERMGKASDTQRAILDAVDPQSAQSGVVGVPLADIDKGVTDRMRREALRVERTRTTAVDPSVAAALPEERLRELGLREPGAGAVAAKTKADQLKSSALRKRLTAAEENLAAAQESGNPLRITNAEASLEAARANMAALRSKKVSAADAAPTSSTVTADPGRTAAYNELSRRLATFAVPDASGQSIIPLREIRAIQRQWGKDIGSESFGSSLADTAQKEVKKRVYRIINDVTEGKFADLKAWDKEFSFWADVLDVSRRQMQKEAAKRAGRGVAEQAALGGVLGGRFGAIMKTEAAMHLARIISSSTLNASRLQPIRHQLSNALLSDDWVTIGKLMTRAGIPLSLGLSGPKQFQPATQQ